MLKNKWIFLNNKKKTFTIQPLLTYIVKNTIYKTKFVKDIICTSVKQAQKLTEHQAQEGYEAAVHHLHHNNSV